VALEELLAALERDAEAAVQAVRDAAAAEAARIAAESRTQAERRRAEFVAARERELRAAGEVAAAEVGRRTRRAVLEARQGMLDRVFAAARERLAAVATQPAFTERLGDHLAEARAYLGDGPVTVRCPPELTARVRRLARPADGITVVADPAAGTGLRVTSGDGTVEVDNTLDARLARLRPRLALEVLQRLERAP
jgi:fused signal recognition particle receptor